jgi:hypothetical protein
MIAEEVGNPVCTSKLPVPDTVVRNVPVLG